MTFTETGKRYKQIGAAKKCTFIFCADNGVAEENVSAYPKATTVGMMKNYLSDEGAAANVFAKVAGSELYVVDVGVSEDISSMPNLIKRKIGGGTRNIAREAAMTPEEARQSIAIGKELANRAIAADFNCFLIGEMGIGNTTTAAAMTAAYLGLTPKEVTGRGTNIDDKKLVHKIEIVRRALETNKPNPKKELDVLTKVGGYEFGAMAGVILAAHEKKCVVILDGFNSSVAALIAEEINPNIRESLIASHIGRETGHKEILKHLGLNPPLKLDLALGEAIGSSILVRILDRFGITIEDNDELPESIDYTGKKFGLYISEAISQADNLFDAEINIAEIHPDFQLGEQKFTAQDYTNQYSFIIRHMGEDEEDKIAATDKTFNFYLQTMPQLSIKAMTKCRERLDSLTKPKNSLGYLEEIAVQIAGISNDECPVNNLGHGLLIFANKSTYTEESAPKADLIAKSLGIEITLGLVTQDEKLNVAFNFGRNLAEEISFETPLVALTCKIPDEDLFIKSLQKEDGTALYAAEEFLSHVPEEYRCLTGALIGALVAAAHNSCLIIADIGATETITRYVEELCPQIRPFVLHSAQLLTNPKGLIISEGAYIGLETAEAALTALNEMKTFDETGVKKAIGK